MLRSILYTRVSTRNQGIDSLNIQNQLCLDYLNSEGIILSESHSEVGSAFNGQQKVLMNILNNNNNCNLFIWNISRFSRNISKGVDMIKIANDNNINIIFIEEKLISSNFNHIHQIRVKISESQLESETLSNRLNQRNKMLKKNGWKLGNPNFGFKSVIKNGKRKFCKCDNEKKIVDFIIQARNGTSCKQLNSKLRKIIPKADPITFYDSDGQTKINYFNHSETLTFEEISVLLNDYEIKKRGKIWSSSSVNDVFKKNTTLEAQLGNFSINV